ncbi:hypothetical protein HanIR_Chr04g0197801 [Helianthus annuus]|nr:hypothetical protein HanIR_Chr04g0197801 [Helianthus annuus]
MQLSIIKMYIVFYCITIIKLNSFDWWSAYLFLLFKFQIHPCVRITYVFNLIILCSLIAFVR